ncbi:hypothetical protein B0A55_13056 [Friedmanniomyces simplex]|uniref:Uncharacterized protein n=1 Tax=Friedmanniomyces simplex TaxID=329884 RepID=A0A4U0VSC6_9PEZI|nr:hypothetical protein B0A55_13056 [Friedmanniomyces simplex]
MTQDAIEALIARKVTEALAERAADQTALSEPPPPPPPPSACVPDELQRRLDALEKRVGGQETERAEGLQYLLMAKQHQVRSEEGSALKMYLLALPHFPGNEKLGRKVRGLRERIEGRRAERERKRGSTDGGVELPKAAAVDVSEPEPRQRVPPSRRKAVVEAEEEGEAFTPAYEPQAEEEDADFSPRPRTKLRRPLPSKRSVTTPLPAEQPAIKHSPPPIDDSDNDNDTSEDELASALVEQTPRTRHLLNIINTKDVSQIKLLKGVGAKKAEAIVNCLCDLDEGGGGEGVGGAGAGAGAGAGDGGRVKTLSQLGKLRGVGVKGVENMRVGLGRMGV